MNEKIVDLVKEKLSEIFEDYPQTSDIHELAAELKSDLISSAEDKFKDGMSEESAVDKAFDEFGDITDLIDDVMQDDPEENSNEGHHIDINQSGITIDGGDKLKIDKKGVFINKGNSFRADGSGVSINNGKVFRADENGVKVGNMTIDGRGINFEKNKSKVNDTFSKFDESFDHNVDTEIYVETLDLVNEKSFEISDIKRLDISYGFATVKILPSNGDKVILREYMSRNNPDYFARTKVDEGTLKIKQGRFPKFLHLKVRTQILIPKTFLGDMRITSVAGNLYIDGISNMGIIKTTINSGNGYFNNVSVNNFSVKAQSGKIKIKNVKADDLLQLLAHSGAIRIENVLGNEFEIKAHSGSVRGEKLGGSGTIESHSGAVTLSISELTGDLNIDSHSGAVKLNMLTDNYKFDLQAKSGTVRSPEGAILNHDTFDFKDGFIGDNPVHTINARALSGAVKLY
ncbi:DUF4097 domain-containing protein [Companilactobacillus allii]|uniref:DUF4097 domain-containing protein n=1 Tax=Companilactobacillus allii TaxID=1847728 RepID=A0A1P8Q586_9LACO|nr:DUF4097 family beta strand repeat-containing protein [Companilactobacillus allii]APX72995.1 hypothetical protein BTM29_10730 [Companilactobacillus allii]USQ67792.1 DUF4097 domain-containing protein [Companilactobacillus allii]